MTSFFRVLLIAGSLFIATVAVPTLAETPEQTRIKELEHENEELRTELAQLRLELSQLKRELEKHQKASAESESEERDPNTESNSADADEKGDSQEKNKPRAFRSADEIYRLIPQGMRPAKDGWDVAQKQSVAEWFKTNITGKKFEARKKISELKITYNSLNRIWEVRIDFESEKMRYMSWDMEERLSTILLRGDKEFADNARKKFKAGNTVNLTGTISAVNWDLFVIQKAEENWHPTHCTLMLEAVDVR